MKGIAMRGSLPPYVSTQEDLIKNILAYRSEVAGNEELQERLALHRSWYACWDDEQGWCFAPSKWAGYRGMTANEYLEKYVQMNGRKTEEHLSILLGKPKGGTSLTDELSEFLAIYGKQPSAIARITVVNGNPGSDNADDLPDLIVRVVRTLSAAQQKHIRQALRI